MPLIQVEALLREHAIPNLHWLMDEVMLYLANSWSRLDNGLFDPSDPRNLTIALDLAISQILLPGTADMLRRLGILREQLHNLLAGQFPRSAAFVYSFAE